MVRLPPLAALLMLLSGCATMTGGETLLIFDAVSVINTEKTIPDHVLSLASGKDCSTLRAQRDGVYCVESAPPPAPTAPSLLYCYRTIGQISCYDRALGGNDHLVGVDSSTSPMR